MHVSGIVIADDWLGDLPQLRDHRHLFPKLGQSLYSSLACSISYRTLLFGIGGPYGDKTEQFTSDSTAIMQSFLTLNLSVAVSVKRHSASTALS